ncbi:MAG: four helix bundle protein [Candidatus Wallbacteria bacterium]|nr:four helix bundle protein [Candidatus Wallbacteria bacterium]
MATRGYQELEVWKKAHNCVVEIYRLTRDFPKEEMFGLVSQLRRAAVSIPANIAEGYRRSSIPEKLRFYNISQASLDEAAYYLLLAKDLKYATTDTAIDQLDEIARMLSGYIAGIRRRTA